MQHFNTIALSVSFAPTALACSSTPEGAADPTPSTDPPSGPATPLSVAPSSTVTEPLPDTTTSTRSTAELEELREVRTALDPLVGQATAPWRTDWRLTNIDLGELELGIGRVDPRDAIPPIDQPEFESVDSAAIWLLADEPGALVQLDGEARFYPLSILHRHEVVNDQIAGVPIAMTYCPLCNTALAFDRRLDGVVLRMGVSGLLRNSDLVMWDDQSVSLWQQITGEAIVGAATGARLTPISTAIVSFGDFAAAFPDGLSLSQNTGFGIAYGAHPYRGYSSAEVPFRYDGDVDPRYAALSRVVGVTVNSEAKAYPFEEIESLGVVNDVVGGEPIVVFWGGGTLDALDSDTVSSGRAIGTGVAYLSTVGDQTPSFSKIGDTWTDAETGSAWTLLGGAIEGPLTGQRLTTAVHRNEFWFAWGTFFPDSDVFEG